jgi:hypothetical protein
MDRTDVAYIINSTPSYYYLLIPHLALLKRYAPQLQWQIYIGTEVPDHPIIKRCIIEFNVKIIICDASFWESRVETVHGLPLDIKYIFPVQEDFLLERPGMNHVELKKVLDLMDENEIIKSARVMPCPGPVTKEPFVDRWGVLGDMDDYLFTFQATLWRPFDYTKYLNKIIDVAKTTYYCKQGSAAWNKMAVGLNLAENQNGREIFKNMFKGTLNLAWIRHNSCANAVYDCPFPYRPTAVVKGILQPWAQELLDREGIRD